MRGLTNLGNTCYLNAALQCLLFAPPLTNYVLSGLAEADLHRRRLNACALAGEYVSLAKAYWGSPPPATAAAAALDTRPLWAALCKLHRPFANAQPHDAHEALTALLKHLHDAFSKAPRLGEDESFAWRRVDRPAWEAQCAREGYSLMLTELFQGQMELVVTGPGGYRSVTHEHFTGLTLDVPTATTTAGAKVTVAECLDRHVTETVRIEGYKIPALGGAEAAVTQTKAVRYAPLVLVLHLKANVDNDVGAAVEISTRVRLGGDEYELFAACLHAGGHYTAVCRQAAAAECWTLFDDCAAPAPLPPGCWPGRGGGAPGVLMYRKLLHSAGAAS